jgi:hypothetical protein
MFVLIPLINAVFDWISISVTRCLLHNSLQGKDPLLNFIHDAIIALFCAVGVTTVTILVMYLVNHLVGDNVYNISHHVGAVKGMDISNFVETFKQHGWFILCFYTTLLPTIIHLSTLVISTGGSMPVVSDFKAIARKVRSGEYRDNQQDLREDRDKILPYFNLNDANPYVPVLRLRSSHILGRISLIGSLLWLLYVLAIVMPSAFFGWAHDINCWLGIADANSKLCLGIVE